MMIIVTMTLSIITLLILLISLNSIISKKSWMDAEKSSPFECGFDPKSSARMPFSIQFFMITIIFLIFDVEITIILPMIKTMTEIKIQEIMITFNMFLMILLLGTYHEWNQGALNWEK
uniref:NADH-ubiquinone oxidoreductase chain 3 n=1 Tax=Gibbium aequinoctiale TaxID=1050274 RepID=A0A8J9QYR9_9COLE|nr:NADH dehydrogenase subunit 3 [Gibbium aequinoctiale]ATN40783.1 NADH dehydrogenase subunit 3 [Gibbium aequinoctiale]